MADEEIKIDFSGLYDQAPKNLKICDSEYLDSAEDYYSIGKQMEKITGRYIKTLKKLGGSLSGNFADNITIFAEKVDFYLSQTMNGSTRTLSDNMKNYINDIDEKDGEMY